MNSNQYVYLPFPYFCIDQDYNIKATSVSAFHNSKFTNLLNPDHVESFYTFINHTDDDSEVFFISLEQEFFSPHRVYKKKDTDGIFHIFCHPFNFVDQEIFEQLNYARQKLALSSKQILEQQVELENMKREYDEISRKSSYFTHVGELAAGIAHEIRNPLTTIKGFIQLIQAHLVNIQKEEYAKIALEEIDRANEILYQFLNAAKPQNDEKERVSLNKLIREITLLYEGEANLKNISLETSFAPENPSVVIQGNQLKQVLVNMMKNAMEAIHSTNRIQGKILLATEVSQEQATITIKDNGCGMTNELMNNLFTPFYSTKTTGTGLGLSICKKIVDEQGGNIRITSKEGHGTSIMIELPYQTEYQLHA